MTPWRLTSPSPGGARPSGTGLSGFRSCRCDFCCDATGMGLAKVRIRKLTLSNGQEASKPQHMRHHKAIGGCCGHIRSPNSDAIYPPSVCRLMSSSVSIAERSCNRRLRYATICNSHRLYYRYATISVGTPKVLAPRAGHTSVATGLTVTAGVCTNTSDSAYDSICR